MELQVTWTEVRNRVVLTCFLFPKLTLTSLVTREVQDYILCYKHNYTLYEIHLIDSPGFDDGTLNDTEVLSDIATYVNTTYKLNKRLAGVLYLHDITNGKLGGVGQRNLRMLERMIGQEEYSNCTLVTTKWGCTKSSQDEEQREVALRDEKKFFGGMLGNAQQARMERFHPKTRARALEIIAPYLNNKFTPQISQQMVDPSGPKLHLRETEAGKVIAENLEKLQQRNQEPEKLKRAWKILSQKYDEELFSEYKKDKKALRNKIRLKRTGRWIMRFTIVGGAITATILTLGPGASTFVLVPLFEKAVSEQKKAEKKEKEDLDTQYLKNIKKAGKPKDVDPDWWLGLKIQRFQEVEAYNLIGEGTDMDLARIMERDEVVEIIASDDGFEAAWDDTGLPMDESSGSDAELLESDAELLESDDEKE